MAAAEPNNALGFYRRGVSLRKEGSTRVPSGISVKRFGCFRRTATRFASEVMLDLQSAIVDLRLPI
jgi:hypothetical protein